MYVGLDGRSRMLLNINVYVEMHNPVSESCRTKQCKTKQCTVDNKHMADATSELDWLN